MIVYIYVDLSNQESIDKFLKLSQAEPSFIDEFKNENIKSFMFSSDTGEVSLLIYNDDKIEFARPFISIENIEMSEIDQILNDSQETNNIE